MKPAEATHSPECARPLPSSVTADPVEALSPEAFKEALRLLVDAEKSLGRSRTKSSIELSDWLDALDGSRSRAEFNRRFGSSFFGRKELLELRKSGIEVLCYLRMARDASQA